MLNLRMKVFSLMVTALLLGTGSALAARYEIVPGDQSQIIFKSKAPMEKFDGKTRQLSGFFEADLNNLAGPVTLEVQIDLASFDTGKKKRNQHMRENHLETDKFPQAWFRAGSIKQCDHPALVPGGSVTLLLHGTLDLHGVKKDHDVELHLTMNQDGAVRVRGQFPVLLSEHAIDRPKFLVMKLADEQRVVVDLLTRAGS